MLEFGQNYYLITLHSSSDRYVIIGAHYDSWTYGAMDPNSGTAILMEVAKALAAMKEKGILYNNP